MVMVLWEIFPIWVHLPLAVIRGVTFPIMAFFVVEGFRRTSNIKRYMLRLLIFGAIAQVPYMLALGLPSLNIIFSILLGLICLAIYDKLFVQKEKKGLFVFLFIVILIVSTFIVEGGLFALMMIFLFHVIKNEKSRRTWPLVLWGAFMILSNLIGRFSLPVIETAGLGETIDLGIVGYEAMLLQYPVFAVGTFLIIPLLRAYNGELGRRAKYLFYTFYPLHFAILAAIAFALGLRSIDRLFIF